MEITLRRTRHGVNQHARTKLFTMCVYAACRVGLGTSTAEEGREYFSNLDKHLLPFTWSGPQDGDDIVMAFSKDKVQERKVWLSEGDSPSLSEVTDTPAVHQSPTAVTFSDFINKELIHFSRADILRSIPSAVDGLKPSQRKVLFGCFKRNLKDEVKVSQLAGYIRCAKSLREKAKKLRVPTPNMRLYLLSASTVLPH